MSLALYRKYRPGSFAEVVGQEHVTGPLQQALRNGRVHHAYLFSGPRGCGKTSSARILARSLNCAEGPTPTPCGRCDSCVALAPNGPGSLDVVEIDAASHGGVDDARDLRERAFYAPVSSQFKVYIIDEAHMVTSGGFNALLKLVEEPPPHLKFVFATTEPEKVIGTIRSRTHHYPFRLMPPRELLGLVANICAQEGVEVDPLVLPLVVRAGAGSARDALSVLDQLLAGTGPEGLTYPQAVALLGYTDAALLDEVLDAFAARDAAAVFEVVDRVVAGGHDPRRFAADLLERFRDLLILEAVPDAADKGLLDCPDDQLERMRVQAARLGAAELTRAGDLLNTGLAEMRGVTAPRLHLELMCARVLLPAAASDETAILVRLDRLERRFDIGTPTAGQLPAAANTPVPTTAPPVVPEGSSPAARRPDPDAAPAPTPSGPRGPAAWPQTAVPGVPAEAVERPATVAVTAPAGSDRPAAPASPVEEAAGGELDAAAVRRVWTDVLDAVRSRKRTAWALLSQYAQVVDVQGRSMTLAFSTEPIRRQFSGSLNEDVLVEALRQVLGVEWRIETVSDGATSRTGAAGNGVTSTASGSASAATSGAVTGPAATGAASAPAFAPGPPGSPAGPGSYDGFAPGDEASEDSDEPGAYAASPRRDPEEAAVALVQENLGAKVIGQIDAG